MGEDTKIQWADHTLNFWLGCDPVHTGCTHCYAQDYFKRFGIVGKRRKTSESTCKQALKWDRNAASLMAHWESLQRKVSYQPRPERPRVFSSMMDPFEDWTGPIVNAKGEQLFICCGCPAVNSTSTPLAPVCCGVNMWRPLMMNDLRRDMFGLIDQTPNLDWPLLTKRPENIQRFWPPRELQVTTPFSVEHRRENCWLLYSASDQASLEAGIGSLLACRDLVPVLGLSLEPLLGPIDLGLSKALPIYREADTVADRAMSFDASGQPACVDSRTRPGRGWCRHDGNMQPWVDWVIVGGESGPNARPCQLEWILDIVQQCEAAGVPCFVKQVGSNYSDEPNGVCGHNTKWPFDVLPNGPTKRLEHPKGGDPKEWPEAIRVQQSPEVK